MPVIISQMAVLFVLLAVGYTAGKAKTLTSEGAKTLSKVVLFIATPCTILNSVMSGAVRISGGDTLFYLLMAFVVFFIAFLVAIPAARALCKGPDRGLYCYMCVFGNVTFMGLPVSYAIFGPVSAFYVALLNIPFMLFSFSVGIYLIAGKNSKFNPMNFLNPSLIAALISIPIAVTGLGFPVILTNAIGIIGNMTTPGAMLVIGATLSKIAFADVFKQWRLYPLTVFKLVVTPVVTWLVLRVFIIDELMLGVLVVLSGMPVAAASAMFALEYGGNEKVASSGVFLSTLLSGATIPLLVFLLLR